MSVAMVKIMSDRQNIHLPSITETTRQNLSISHSCAQEIRDPVLIQKWVDIIKSTAVKK